MKVVTWNVNSINQRLDHLHLFLQEEDPDVLMLQETKCTDENFPIQAIRDLGYYAIFCGQKSYNGVAILSKHCIQPVDFTLIEDGHTRYIEGILHQGETIFRFASIYAPHGQSPEAPRFGYKMQFFDNLIKRTKALTSTQEIIIMGGDYNVAPENIDVHDHQKLEGSMGFNIMERQKLRYLLNSGVFDSFRLKNPQKKEFSWWDYRSMGFAYNKGMRIDHILTCAQGIDLAEYCYVAKKFRELKKPSDHAPVVLKICVDKI